MHTPRHQNDHRQYWRRRIKERLQQDSILAKDSTIPDDIWHEFMEGNKQSANDLFELDADQAGYEGMFEEAVDDVASYLEEKEESRAEGEEEKSRRSMRRAVREGSKQSRAEALCLEAADAYYAKQLGRLPAVAEFRQKLGRAYPVALKDVWPFLNSPLNQLCGLDDMQSRGWVAAECQVSVGERTYITVDNLPKFRVLLTVTPPGAKAFEHRVEHSLLDVRCLREALGVQDSYIFGFDLDRDFLPGLFPGATPSTAGSGMMHGFKGTAVGEALSVAQGICRARGERRCNLSARDAFQFLLTGELPTEGDIASSWPMMSVIRPGATPLGGSEADGPSYLAPRRIIISAYPWVSPESVTHFFRVEQRRLGGAARNSLRLEHGLRLFNYVNESLSEARDRASGRPTWKELCHGWWSTLTLEEWKRIHPTPAKESAKDRVMGNDYRNFRTDYWRVFERLFPNREALQAKRKAEGDKVRESKATVEKITEVNKLTENTADLSPSQTTVLDEDGL